MVVVESADALGVVVLSLIQVLIVRDIVFLVFLVGLVPSMVKIALWWLVDLLGGAPQDRVGRQF